STRIDTCSVGGDAGACTSMSAAIGTAARLMTGTVFLIVQGPREVGRWHNTWPVWRRQCQTAYERISFIDLTRRDALPSVRSPTLRAVCDWSAMEAPL